jgi:uncharacterized protein YbjQ (UPF0145 family)
MPSAIAPNRDALGLLCDGCTNTPNRRGRKLAQHDEPQSERRQIVDAALTTTAFTLDGHRIVRSLGVVRGITVRSRSIFGTIGGSLQTLVGGNISLFSSLCEKTRAEAFELMLAHARERGANAVIGVRYDATEVMSGVTEVLCYGTAVVVAADHAG